MESGRSSAVKHNSVVFLLCNVDDAPTRAATANLRKPLDNPDGGLQRTIHDSSLACDEGCNNVSIRGSHNVDWIKFQVYPYTLITDEEVLERFGPSIRLGCTPETIIH